MRVCLFLFFAVFAKSLFGQAPVDSLAIAKEVDSLILISRALTGKQDFGKALEINEVAEKIALKKLGPGSAVYGSCIHNHGRVFHLMGEYSDAEKWYLESIDIRSKNPGKRTSDYAQSLNSLGILDRIMGKFDEAEAHFQESLSIYEKTLGKEHPIYANTLKGFAVLYTETGKYEKAEPIYLEVKAILERFYGREHPEYANSLNNLGDLYYRMGQFDLSEHYQLEAKNLREKLLGKEHPAYAASLSNLGNLYRDMGIYEKAEPLLLESLAIRENAFGKEHPEYLISLGSLANLYMDMGEYKKAEPLILKTVELAKQEFGAESLDYTMGLNNLASLYFDLRNFSKAEALFLEAVAIWEKSPGKESPLYASGLHNLAVLYKEMGDFKKAESFALKSLNIREITLGKSHLDFSSSLSNFAQLNALLGQIGKAETLYTELSTLNKSLIINALSFLSEKELYSFIQYFSNSQSQILNLAQLSGSEKTAQTAFDNSLFYKGFLLNSAMHLHRLSRSNPAANEKFNTFKICQQKLAAEYAQPIAERDIENLTQLENQANDLEKDLARMVAGFGEANRQVRWQDVQSQLKPGASAIEFVNFKVSFPHETGEVFYAALVLLPGKEPPKFIPLFEEKTLQNLLKTSEARKSGYVNRIYTIQKTTEKSLYELVWKPLEKALAETKTVYFSPSGLLHRLNLNAIPINEKETLSDRYHLVELGSTRQLVISSESTGSSPDAGQALLFGGVQYDLKSDSTASQNIDIESNITGTRGDLNFSFTDSTDRGGTWNYLKWTDKEVTALEPILSSAQIQPTVLKGYTATEEAFKSIGSNVKKSPRILHIATHGYFFPDPKETPKGSTSGLGAEPVFKLSDHPMIRSGLILAGGNQAWKTGKPLKPGMEDGILTAYEISQMDLSNTELVVLSACETGLGEIQGNEGVYGLQRAFKIAGAKYLIMSLWQVPDFQTQELMTTFYTNWLTKKQPIPDAFRAAQQAMREKYEHPYFWAGFVLVE